MVKLRVPYFKSDMPYFNSDMKLILSSIHSHFCYHFGSFRLVISFFDIQHIPFMSNGGLTTKRARLTVGTVCDTCGGKKSTSNGYDQHQRSGYLRDTPCHLGNDGSNRSQMVATTRANMSTALLQKRRLSNVRKSSGAMHRVHIVDYLADLVDINILS